MSTLGAVSLVVSFLSLSVAATAAYSTWKFNAVAARIQARYQLTGYMLDVDRLLLADPDLWAIYDSQRSLVKDRDSDTLRLRRESLIYLYLNVFELRPSTTSTPGCRGRPRATG